MEKLRRQRGILRGSTTRLLTVASDILREDTQPSLGDLQEIIDGLRSKESALAEIDSQIADSLDGEAFDEEVAGAIDYREKIVNAMSRLRFAMSARATAGAPVSEGQLQRLAGTSSESSNAIGAAHTELISETTAAHGRPRALGLRVNLPKLQIPVFAGETREWQGFWEHYEATIHAHPDLADIEKFQYLKSYLTGAAKRAIEGIRLTDANYKIAVKVLTERYGRKDVLIDNHIDSLLSIEPI
ncbi:uncharacterized protein LOC144146648 [Haemaphysalis longicornis]